jgi:aryl-alcohol dehydrogenase-like predicted oxidoreductase
MIKREITIERTVIFAHGIIVPAVGQGSARLAQGKHPAAEEEAALRTGLSLRMTLIDTAETYSNGRSEKLISRVIAGQRDHVFLVSKVYPSHVEGNGIARACEATVSVRIFSISICCTGRMVSPTYQAS